tara:strand:- start:224 stop:1243 length:1020 start_codon:yes stop_codon:yes gene_type:complete
MDKINVLITGSTGYIGVQLVKLLIKHPYVNIKYLCGQSSVGKKISSYDNQLKNKNLPKIVKFNKKYLNDVDVIFSSLPNGKAQILSKNLLKKNILIDLSADFRLSNTKTYKKYYKVLHKAKDKIKNSIYSIPEFTKKKVKKFKIISCPGCYPTSILLPLIPLLKARMILSNVIADSKSGYSGAGRSIHKKYENKNLYESLSAYGLAIHRHNSEIDQQINKFYKGKFNLTFTPHLSPMFRGILTTIYFDIPKGKNLSLIYKKLLNEYKYSKFVKICKFNKSISTNDVINTNNCIISVCKSKFNNKGIIISAIDNLIKGGSGQAIQNFNLYFGFNESLGLK